LKILEDASSTGNGTGITASSHWRSTLQGTKVSDLYKYFIFLTILGIFGFPLTCTICNFGIHHFILFTLNILP
jgi:hypothetical protein